MKRVVIVQRRMTHYRVSLFERLREDLRQRGVLLSVLAGEGTRAEKVKSDVGVLHWSLPLTTYYIANGRLCLQPMGKHLRDADLVVVTQENKLLYNYLLLLLPRRFKLAFWGHGANLQSNNPTGLKERLKSWTTNRVDWWFAYTQMSSDLVKSAGFPESRITVVNNAVDTEQFLRQRQSVTLEETAELRKSLNIGVGPVGIYVGSLYAEKRLDFLFNAVKSIKARVPDFYLLIVGDGKERGMIREWCSTHSWAKWVGPKFGREKAAHIAMAEVMLNPGLVGLGILDSFVCAVPMLTTDCGIHSPEVVYLESGVNGIMTSNDLNDYVDACVCLLNDQKALDVLRAGCKVSAQQYTLENMSQRFAQGVTDALAA